MSQPTSPSTGEALFDRVATAPISWGVCEVPGWGRQLSVDRVLSEMAQLGFSHTELGSAGWLPAEPVPLQRALAGHGLSLLGGFVPLVLHRPAEADVAMEAASAAARLLADSGARYFVTAPVTSPGWEPRQPVEAAGWDHLCLMLERVGQLCQDHGLEQVVHEHVGCVIETAEEVDRLLADTDVAIVLDTGHLTIGGHDPLELAHRRADRIGLVHLKDTDRAVAARLNDGRSTLMEAVQDGLFPALGRGDLPLAEIVEATEAAGYRGWYVIEQDCALTGDEPALGQGPVRDVGASIAYLRSRITTFAPRPGVASARDR